MLRLQSNAEGGNQSMDNEPQTSEPQFNQSAGPKEPSAILAMGVGIVGGIAGAGLYCGIVAFANNQLFPLLIVGPLIGLAMKYVGRSHDSRMGVIAIILTIIACMVGFVIADMNIVPWKPPSTFKMAFGKLFSISAVMIGFSAYFSYSIAIPRMSYHSRAMMVPHCPHCHYDLTGAPRAKHCPECGKKILDPGS
jgi:hypothetical protein